MVEARGGLNPQTLSTLAYGLAFAGLALWAALVAATALFGVALPYPLSLVWVAAAGLPALGVALLFLIATSGREEEEAGQ